MTTKLSLRYEKSTAHEDPKIQVSLHVSALTYLKLFLYSLIGQPQLLWHTLTEAEVEVLSRYIVRWRIVRKFRSARKS